VGTFEIAGKLLVDTIGQDVAPWRSTSVESAFTLGVSTGLMQVKFNTFTGEFDPEFGVPKVSNFALRAMYKSENLEVEGIFGTDTDPVCKSIYDILGSMPWEKGDPVEVSLRVLYNF
jgi:hypothetical protein